MKEPERMPPSRAELALRQAVILERVARIEKARDLQAIEYARRLDDLNHAHQRSAEILAASVTVEKFEDYAGAQKEALQLAFEAATAKTDSLAQRNADRIVSLDSRVDELSARLMVADSEARDRDRTAGRMSDEERRRRDRLQTWAIASIGFVLTAIVIITGILEARLH